MGPDCERVDEYRLGPRESLAEAVNAFINLHGMQPCEICAMSLRGSAPTWVILRLLSFMLACHDKQVMMFSATLSKEIHLVCKKKKKIKNARCNVPAFYIMHAFPVAF
ncbi:Coatomer subunit gamma-2 [Spatholobus suberectus]|nr:Coatomer subunit gamma-2 [Spatholobus suberectus]